MLGQVPILVPPQTQGGFVLDTDVSDKGIGAVLSQVQDRQEKVIAFGSKMLTKSEHNYCITRQELLAVVHFVSQYKHFLLWCKFLVRTDNSAVRYWMKIHSDSYDPQDQTARWMVRLGAFDFEIRHRIGKQHTNVDGMSRQPLLKCAQCDIRHQRACETQQGKKVDLIMTESSTQKLQSRKWRRANQMLSRVYS